MNTTKRIIQAKASSNESPWSTLLWGLWRMSLGLKAFYWWSLQDLQSPLLLLHCVEHSTINWNFTEADGKLTENYKAIWKIAFHYQKWNEHDGLLKKTQSDATCKSCRFFRNFKEVVLSVFQWQRSVTQQTFRTNLYRLITGEGDILSAKEISRLFSTRSLWLQIWISFVFCRESSHEHLNNPTLPAPANRAHGTAQALEAKGVGILIQQKDGKI